MNSKNTCPPNVIYTPCFLSKTQADALFVHLQTCIPWKQGQVKVFGKVYDEPRLSAWIGDSGLVYTYAGKRQTPLPWTEEIQHLKKQVNDHCNISFNSVLLNLYRDGNDTMGMHRDNEPELGPNPCIASLSLGTAREFILQAIHNKTEKYSIPLAHGSLLVMQGNTQHVYKHGIPRRKRIKSPRINLTFRTISSAIN